MNYFPSIDMIAAERERQVEKHGYDKEHDDWHVSGELAEAAQAHLLAYADMDPDDGSPPPCWPFQRGGWAGNRSHERHLKIAAGFVAAELDRLSRTGEAVQEVLGVDVWRVPPWAPNPHGRPVAHLPHRLSRVWLRRHGSWGDRDIIDEGEYTTDGQLEPMGDGEEDELWIRELGDADNEEAYVPISKVVGWRPPAVGP